MVHVVYVDTKDQELGKLLSGSKRMIIRGAAGRKLPYGRINPGDRLFFIQNNGDGLVRARSVTSSVINSDKLSPEESSQMVERHQNEPQLSPAQLDRWRGKRYLVLIGLSEVTPLEPFAIDPSEYGSMDDWLPVGDIERVKITATPTTDA